MLSLIPLTTLQIGGKAEKEDGGDKSAGKDDDSGKEALSFILAYPFSLKGRYPILTNS